MPLLGPVGEGAADANDVDVVTAIAGALLAGVFESVGATVPDPLSMETGELEVLEVLEVLKILEVLEVFEVV